ncbi:MAG TPA: NUDIX domain-containing protein [Candidatus Paceibacterota bacterium]|nr:NUDIX domain-containing protein [Candidatus Paceibacterota bacterium]
MENIRYQGNLIEIIEKEVDLGKTKRVFELARRSPGVRLIIPKGDTILVSKEYRSEVGGDDYRLPGGKVYDSLKEYNQALANGIDITEAAKQAAVKEAHEEVGVEAHDLSFFHKSVCGATVVWDLFYFVVTAFTETGEQHLEHGEDISYEFIDKEKARAMCLDGSISEERSALVLLRFLNA